MKKIRKFLIRKKDYLNRYRLYLSLGLYVTINLMIEPKLFIHILFLASIIYFTKFLKR